MRGLRSRRIYATEKSLTPDLTIFSHFPAISLVPFRATRATQLAGHCISRFVPPTVPEFPGLKGAFPSTAPSDTPSFSIQKIDNTALI